MVKYKAIFVSVTLSDSIYHNLFILPVIRLAAYEQSTYQQCHEKTYVTKLIGILFSIKMLSYIIYILLVTPSILSFKSKKAIYGYTNCF